MRIWIALFTVALLAGGACLGVVIDRNMLAHAQVAAVSQESGRGGSSYEMSVSRFADELELTDEQNEQLDHILGEAKRDVEAYRRASRTATDKSREKVTALLTEGQRTKLNGLVSAEKQKRQERDVERSLRLYTAALGLSPEQAAAVGGVLVEMKAKRREFLQANSHGGDWSKMRAFTRGLHAEQARRYESVFTAEQMKKYRDLADWFE